MNRGSNIDREWLSRRKIGFNEAPIHESGKYYCQNGSIGSEKLLQ